MLFQDSKQLTRQIGGVADDQPVFDQRPFGMGAGQQHAGALCPSRIQQKGPGDLDFLAAHHVRQLFRFVKKHAGGNQDVRPQAARHGHSLFGQRTEICRTAHIGRFFPALGAAHHAAGDDRQLRPLTQPIRGNFSEGLLVTGNARLGQALDAVAGLARLGDFAVAHQESAQAGGAPVEGKQLWRHRASLSMLEKANSTRSQTGIRSESGCRGG